MPPPEHATRLDPAVAAVRVAVRGALGTGTGSPLVLVACSGGADSMALAAATAFVAPRAGWRAGLVTVDHQLQPGSDIRAREVVAWGRSIGLTPACCETVTVGHGGGPEAAARAARYKALVAAAQRYQASLVLLGHTEDDQAETVLLALTRGSGPRGLAGMPAVRQIDGIDFARPLLATSRDVCRKAVAALGLSAWDDPHNADPSFTRARVRHAVLPVLVTELGADVPRNLARTASLVAADAAFLDELATVAYGHCLTGDDLLVTALATLATPLRTRVLHRWAIRMGVPGAALSHRHIAALDAFVTSWHGQGPAQLPGGVSVHRHGTTLAARPSS